MTVAEDTKSRLMTEDEFDALCAHLEGPDACDMPLAYDVDGSWVCDHTHIFTRCWLTTRGLDANANCAALYEAGARCDCTVLLNVFATDRWPEICADHAGRYNRGQEGKTMAEAHYSYTMGDALEDGTFVKVFEKDWPTLTGGHPIVATRTLYDALGQGALIEVYNGYIHWVNEIAPTLPATERRFTTQINGRDVSVAQDGSSLNMFWADED